MSKKVLLVSAYDSGFQSLGVASGAAALLSADIPVDTLDLSIDSSGRFPRSMTSWAMLTPVLYPSKSQRRRMPYCSCQPIKIIFI